MTMIDDELDYEFYDDFMDFEDDDDDVFEFDDDDDDIAFEYDDDDDAFFAEYLDAVEDDEDDDDFYGEYDDDDDAAERRRRRRRRRRHRSRRRRRRPASRARRRRYARRPSRGGGRYATKTELAAGLARARKEVLRNAKGIKQLDARVAGVAAAGKDGRARLRRDTTKKLKKLEADMKRQQQMSLLLPMLTKKDTTSFNVTSITNAAGAQVPVPAGTVVTVSDTDSGNDSMLPLLLMSGSGGGDNSDLLMMLAISGNL